MHSSKAKASPHILCVNPWIHDFAAYDFWAKPYGLLSLAAMLRDHGLEVSYIDCLDRFHPQAAPTDPRARHGRGPYLKTTISKPQGLAHIPRNYSRYGILPQWFHQDLNSVPRPDLILITSAMSYWYPGVFETIGMLKDIFPDVPVVLGGVYARLWTEHAQSFSGADEVATDRGASLLKLVEKYTGVAVQPHWDPSDLDASPYPAFDLQHRITYIALLTARGCPFECAYCAARYLEPTLRRRTPRRVVEEIEFWHRNHGVIDFAFYDDALLIDAEHHAQPILEGVVGKQLPIRFHTPNALHIRSITAEVADLLYRAGFHTLRLGLETTEFEQRSALDGKVDTDEFEQAVAHLKKAGFRPDQIGAYLLAGLPGQSIEALEASIQVVKASGITPVPAYYTPMPHTRLWDAARTASRYDLAADPIYTNNAIFPCWPEEFSWKVLSKLKTAANSKGL